MGKVTYSPGIQYVNGALAKPKKENGHNHGDYLLAKHRTAPTTSNRCSTLFIQKGDTYERNTELTATEMAQRAKFSAIARAVANRSKDLSKVQADKEAFNAQKDQPGGKTTMRAYLWALEATAYENANG